MPGAQKVDEICPEMQKAMDVVGVSWLTRMQEQKPFHWQTRVMVSIILKRGAESLFELSRHHISVML